jgi:hypothetical protein
VGYGFQLLTDASRTMRPGFGFAVNGDAAYKCNTLRPTPSMFSSETTKMSEPTRNPDLPIELRLLILKANTEENRLSLKISPRTCPTTRSKQDRRETVLIFAPSEKDQRNLLAVSRSFRREMIQLLWRDLSIDIRWLPAQPVTLRLPAIHIPARDLSRYLKRDSDEQNQDWSHTVEYNFVLTTGPSPLLLSHRYLHTFRLDTTPEGTNKILHPFRG